jgi:hypothetical protein
MMHFSALLVNFMFAILASLLQYIGYCLLAHTHGTCLKMCMIVTGLTFMATVRNMADPAQYQVNHGKLNLVPNLF